MLLNLVLSQKQREKIDGKHESLSGGTVGRDGKEHLQSKAVLGPFSFIAIILSYCLDDVQLDSL